LNDPVTKALRAAENLAAAMDAIEGRPVVDEAIEKRNDPVSRALNAASRLEDAVAKRAAYLNEPLPSKTAGPAARFSPWNPNGSHDGE
jgi:hypothetical protein